MKLYSIRLVTIFSLAVLISCKREHKVIQMSEIDKAIELVSSNKSIDSTFLALKRVGVEFILCYGVITDTHRILGCQIIQTKYEKMPPLKIIPPYKVKKIRGIDVYFATSEKDTTQNPISIDAATKRLIDKGYLTVGRASIIDTESVTYVFCKKNDDVYTVLSPNFLRDEEVKARNKDMPFIIEKYYPARK